MAESSYLPKFPSRYKIERLLGEGALGEVFLATDQETNTKVVIKTLKPALAFSSQNGASNVRRFHNEFNALKNCVHPNIVKVLDFCEYNNLLFFTMEYLEGKPLSSLIPEREEDEDDFLAEANASKKKSPEISYPPFSYYIDYLFQTAKALHFVHERGLIHRDLKPDNVYLTNDGQVKLLDFGLARPEETSLKLTVMNNALGTAYYMAPEAILNKPLDHLADVYSFGILAFELLARELPYQNSSRVQLARQHALAEIPSVKAKNAEVPDWLDAVVKTCMQKEKERRYQSMLEVISTFVKNAPSLSVDKELKSKLDEQNKTIKVERHKANIRADKLSNIKESSKRILIVFILTMLLMVAWFSPIGTYSNIILLRTLFWIRGPIEPPKDVVIVALDDLTYQHFGITTRMQFPRKYWAQALEKIHATKPKLVIIDGYIPKEEGHEEENRALEGAIAKGPSVLVRWERDNTSLPPKERDNTNVITYQNDPRFSKAAFLEISPLFPLENDTVIRLRSSNNNRKTISEQLPMLYALRRAGFENLAEPNEPDYINFYGKPNTLSTISMHEVISGNYDFRNKIVIMGFKSLTRSTSPRPYDLFNTSGSFYDQYFGVEVHATVASNLIDHSYIRGVPPIPEAFFMAQITALLLLCFVTKKPSQVLLYLMIVLSCWFCLTVLGFIQYNFLIPGVSFLLFCSLVVCAAAWYVYGKKNDAKLVRLREIAGVELYDDHNLRS